MESSCHVDGMRLTQAVCLGTRNSALCTVRDHFSVVATDFDAHQSACMCLWAKSFKILLHRNAFTSTLCLFPRRLDDHNSPQNTNRTNWETQRRI